ncbi:MAG: D-alanyl-D-alanine carboxypeptidase (penicillin-binding protein 5/6) [Candidatus Nitrotoga sp. SPKER]|nr:MAG: D-alanyl-D-alanine carboxypeptidase (penicillin-binding protein 5/6) [Candidatus Nitrotoga sp. SPKER]
MKYLVGLLLWCQIMAAQGQPDPFPQAAKAYLVKVDEAFIWEHRPHDHLPPASLTKLMTALLILEQGQLQEAATISLASTRETGSRSLLKAGERFRVQDLLTATMIASSNDACHALADHLSGNETGFVARMNRRAKELGMRDTHFTNACGHDAAQHYSSAHDLARLTHELLKYPSLIEITSQKNLQITTLDGKKRYTLGNKNALIGRYDGALGLKTGYTPKAGKCLVAFAKRSGHEVLLVMLHGKNRWWDAVDILDLAFDHSRAAP